MEHPEIEILLIEDNMNDAEMTMRSLKKNNVSNKVLHLKNGEEALDYIFAIGKFGGRDINKKPRVILLDLKMPKIDGLEVLEKIKSNDLTKNIPVVVLTSSKEDPDINRAYLLGVNSYIVKPVDFDSFHKVVAELGLYWMLTNQPPV
ncbi:MAG: response regulator [Chryseolinea sp.]